MSSLVRFALLGVVMALDALAVTMLFLQPRPVDVLMALLLHVLAALMFTRQATVQLPAHYQDARQDALILVFASTLLLPVLGMIGILIGVGPALLRQRADPARQPLHHYGQMALPEQATDHDSDRGVKWAMRLTGALQHADDPNQRSAALIATLSLEDEMALPLLRHAIKDPEDEVRLLAYALLNRKEKAIEKRIRERTAELESLPIEDTAWQQKALANDYWQLARMVAPRSSTQVSLLERAKEHVQEALKLDAHDGGLQFLLGRIGLEERDLQAASEAFAQAKACGVDDRQIAPMLAEIAFLRGHYGAVRQHLRAAGPGLSQSAWSNALAFWEGDKRVRSSP